MCCDCRCRCCIFFFLSSVWLQTYYATSLDYHWWKWNERECTATLLLAASYWCWYYLACFAYQCVEYTTEIVGNGRQQKGEWALLEYELRTRERKEEERQLLTLTIDSVTSHQFKYTLKRDLIENSISSNKIFTLILLLSRQHWNMKWFRISVLLWTFQWNRCRSQSSFCMSSRVVVARFIVDEYKCILYQLDTQLNKMVQSGASTFQLARSGHTHKASETTKRKYILCVRGGGVRVCVRAQPFEAVDPA